MMEIKKHYITFKLNMYVYHKHERTQTKTTIIQPMNCTNYSTNRGTSLFNQVKQKNKPREFIQ